MPNADPPQFDNPSNESADAAKPRRSADAVFVASDSNDSDRNREEVAGRGSGGTAGGPPAALQCVPHELDEFFAEGGSSNTPSLKTTTGGEDWFTVNLYLIHPDFESFAERLDDAQREATLDSDEDKVSFGDVTFRVASNGARQGDSSKGSWMRWRLRGDNGFTLLLMNSDQSNGIQPNASIRVPSIPLMQKTAKAIWGDIQFIVDGMGAILENAKLSRVDPCVDLAGVDIEEFAAPFRNDWVVTKAKKRATYFQALPMGEYYSGSKSTGFTVGNSKQMVRVYEKLVEAKNSPEKLALLRANRWGCLPDHAVRVEFQLSRDALKNFGVDTVDDWFAKRASICHRLTTKWFRLTSGPVDRKHADRSEMNDRWKEVVEAFQSWTGLPDGAVDLTALAKTEVDNSRLANSAVGFLIGLMARGSRIIRDNDDFLREAVFEIQQAIADREMKSEVNKKQIELGLS